MKISFNTTCLLFSVFLAIFALGATAFGMPDRSGNGEAPSAAIYSVTVEPAKVASGDAILIEAAFSLIDASPERLLPMEYYCEIERYGEIIFKSPAKTMKVTNGAKSNLEISLQASGSPGDYKVVLHMRFPDGHLREEGHFAIVSPMEARMYRDELLEKDPSAKSAAENRILGRWELVSPDTEIPASEIVISKEDGRLTARVLREDARTQWVKLRKTENSLIVRSKSTAPGGGCWYITEDVITFNSRMDDMPVRSSILEGSRCVTVGRISDATLRRLK
jgi:hypothetical protein